jgi:hypothetical protein
MEIAKKKTGKHTEININKKKRTNRYSQPHEYAPKTTTTEEAKLEEQKKSLSYTSRMAHGTPPKTLNPSVLIEKTRLMAAVPYMQPRNV